MKNKEPLREHTKVPKKNWYSKEIKEELRRRSSDMITYKKWHTK